MTDRHKTVETALRGLIDCVHAHHATSTCASHPLKAEADRALAALDKITPCDCADTGCAAHPGLSGCNGVGAVTVRRIDMDPGTMRFCAECWADAIDSGVFAHVLGDDEEDECDDPA